MKMALNTFLLLTCLTFVFPAYSQETTIVPDSVWETSQLLIFYGKEQAKRNQLYLIKEIEEDSRFRELNIEEKYNFYDQVQLGLGQSGNLPDCINYMNKCISFAIEHDREDLLYISNGDNYTYSQYYWLNSYYLLEGTTLKYEEFFDTMMKHLRGAIKVYGVNSKEFLITLLSPYINCNYRNLVEKEHFDFIGNDSITTISPIVRKYLDDSFKTENNHQRYTCLVNAINHSNDSLSLAESCYEYSRYLLENNNVQEGISLMISSIALRSRHTKEFFDSEHALLMLATLAVYYYRIITEQKPEFYASYAMNKILYEIGTEMYPKSDFSTHRRADIISAATRLWRFNEADSLLKIAEKTDHKDRQIENTYARALYYYKKGEATNNIATKVQSKKYFEKLKGTWHWNRFTTLQMLQELYFETKDYRKLEKIQNHILTQNKKQAVERILSVSSKERDYCLNSINSNTIYRLSTPKLLEQAQDASLFRKSLLTSAAIEIDKLANESHEGKELLKKYRQAKYSSTEDADYIERQLLSSCIDPVKLKNALDVTTKDIKKQLKDEELFIDFEACDDSLIVFIYNTNGSRMIQLCEIDSITQTSATNGNLNIVLNTLSPILKDYSVIYFLPAFSLYLMNIEVLFRKEFPNKEFHRVSNLKHLKNHNSSIKNIIAIGNPRYNDNPVYLNSAINRGNVWSPLPSTGVEIREISNAMRHNHNVSVTYYEGTDANEETIKSLDGQNINVLHIATHGIIVEQKHDNREAALLLSGANTDFEKKSLVFGENDGILLASEIENLRLKNLELVILSACDSGIGTINYNEGIKGFQRAFRIAGAHNMIVSIKKVNDEETLNFMTNFYTKLSQTSNIYKSFVYAQDKADEDTRNSFILIE